MMPWQNLAGFGLRPRAAPPSPIVTLNSADKATTITLSNGDLNATKPSGGAGHKSVRATQAVSGLYYYEAKIIHPGASALMMGGYSTAGQSVEGQCSYAYYAAAGTASSPGVDTPYGATLGLNDILGVYYNSTTGKMWFSKNGTLQGSGDPVADTNAAFTGLGAGLYPAVSLYEGGTAQEWNVRFKASDFTYTPVGSYGPIDLN